MIRESISLFWPQCMPLQIGGAWGSKRWTTALSQVACVMLPTALAPASAHSADTQTLGFVVTQWNTAIHETLFMDECPEGPNPGNYEIWESSVSPETRRNQPLMPFTRLQHANKRGANGEDVCVHPTSVTDPPLKTVEGKYAYGINLDGLVGGQTNSSEASKTCKHQDFIGMNGEPGVDNQMYRLLGCVSAWRSGGHIEKNANAHRLSSGLGMILIEVSDIDDTQNDDNVTVTFYRGIGTFYLTSEGEPLPYASYQIDHENGAPRYGDVAQGRIVDGVLQTISADVSLPLYGNYQYNRQVIRDMQIHMPLATPDDRNTGMAYGYYGVDQFYSYVRGLLTAFPNRHKYSCPGIYVAAHELADGHPDPDTGECTTLSSAFRFEAVPAFITHPDLDKVADANAGGSDRTKIQ